MRWTHPKHMKVWEVASVILRKHLVQPTFKLIKPRGTKKALLLSGSLARDLHSDSGLTCSLSEPRDLHSQVAHALRGSLFHSLGHLVMQWPTCLHNVATLAAAWPKAMQAQHASPIGEPEMDSSWELAEPRDDCLAAT